MINRFFKDMPNELNTTGKWRLEILAIFPMKENVVYSTTYQGRLGVAYIKVRLRALLKDWSTSGEYYGVGWRIKKES
ncbi:MULTISPECIES: hypothetical protein [Bacillus cereus group]|uniref:hypothetical protein n=1 Tax=Bacillus cereus group TaxID=86661 RepID=UPI0020D26A03|nr:hypothetical protein [Bacillus cereus]